MNLLIFTAGLLCAFALTAFGQDAPATCDPAQCRVAALCHAQRREDGGKAEKRECVQRCVNNFGVQDCFPDRPEPTAAEERCIDDKICSPENILKVATMGGGMEGGKGKGKLGGKGKGKFGGKGKGKMGGKGKGCKGKGAGKGKGGGKGKGKGKMLEMLLGDAMPEQARQFLECMDTCHGCDEDEEEQDGPECPRPEGCMMRGLMMSAKMECTGRERPDGTEMADKCECLVQKFAPNAPAGICENLERRGGKEKGKGKGKGKGKTGRFSRFGAGSGDITA